MSLRNTRQPLPVVNGGLIHALALATLTDSFDLFDFLDCPRLAIASG
jgi:hypothetical protein